MNSEAGVCRRQAWLPYPDVPVLGLGDTKAMPKLAVLGTFNTKDCPGLQV